MIYAGDLAIAYPVKDIYDTLMMAMSIAAAKDMYEKGLKLIEDFYNKYGDFTSPIQKDMDWYNQNVTGKVRDFINNIYANGGDPLRNAEDRAAVSLLVYSMPVGDIAKLRLSAETAKEYLKSFDDDTNPELEKFLGRDLSNWSTLGDENNPGSGVWGYRKASKYQTIDDLIEPIVKNVDYTYDEDMTKAHNDGNNYYSITRDRLMQAVNDNMSDILATPSGAFHWDQAKKAAAAQGGGEDLAKSIFNTMIGNRLSDHVRTKFEADPFRLDDYRTKNDIRAHAANAATDHRYWVLEHGGDDDENTVHRIFRRAELLTGKKTGVVGDFVQYELPEQYSLFIDPMTQARQVTLKDKQGAIVHAYQYSAKQMKGKGEVMYALGTDGKMHKAYMKNPMGTYTFIPGGNVRAEYIGKDDNGKDLYKYYMSGRFKDDSGHLIKITSNTQTADGNDTQWIAIKERDYNYGQTLKKY